MEFNGVDQNNHGKLKKRHIVTTSLQKKNQIKSSQACIWPLISILEKKMILYNMCFVSKTNFVLRVKIKVYFSSIYIQVTENGHVSKRAKELSRHATLSNIKQIISNKNNI